MRENQELRILDHVSKILEMGKGQVWEKRSAGGTSNVQCVPRNDVYLVDT